MRGARFRFDYAVERDGELIAEGLDDARVRVRRRPCAPRAFPPWLAEAIAEAEG